MDVESKVPFGEFCSPIMSSSSISSSSSSSSGTSSSFSIGPKSLVVLLSVLPISRIVSTTFSVGLRSFARRELRPLLGTDPDLMAATFLLVSHFRSDHFLMTSMTSRWHSPISLTRAVISAHVRFFLSVGTPRLNLPGGGKRERREMGGKKRFFLFWSQNTFCQCLISRKRSVPLSHTLNEIEVLV